MFWIAPKLNVVHRGTLDASVGVLALGADGEGFGIAFGVATWGGPDRAVTAGLGYGFSDGDLADAPAFMLGGELRASDSIKLLAEGYAFEGEGLLGVGLRFFGTRLSADVGIAFPLSEPDVWVPLLNFAYTW